jgi:plastocyanin
MSNKIIIGVIAVIVIIGGVFYFGRNRYSSMQTPTGTQSQVKVDANTVTIQNFAFTPDTLTVPQGTTVTWINQDSAPHKIKSNTFNSPNLGKGDTFTFTFTTKGSFDYTCSIHPSMKGNVVVE